MAGLLSLPEEIVTQIYIFAGQNTRALVRLSAVNRRLRAIWLQDSDHIIAHSLELKAPGHQDAIVLTMMEACCPMPVSGFHHVNVSSDDASLRLHLPGLMRNVALGSAVCNGALKWNNSTYKKHPLISLLPPYYHSMRQLVIAYHYPEFRRPLIDILKRYSDRFLHDGEQMKTYLVYVAPSSLSHQHQLYDMEAEGVLDDEDLPYDGPAAEPSPPATQAWYYQGNVVWRLIVD